MNINLDATFKDLKGEPIKGSDGPLTMREIIQQSLLYDNPRDPHDGTEKYRRYKIQEKVAKANKEVELSVEECATIKKCVGSGFYTTLVVGRVYDAIEAAKKD